MPDYIPLEGIYQVDQILSGFEYYLQNNDLDSAARIINLSDGEIKRIFQNWLIETRLFLETRQTLNAVKAIAETQLYS